VHQLDSFGQKTIDAMLHDGVRLPATDFHDHPRPRLDPPDFMQDRARQAGIAVLVEVLHCGFLADSSSTTGASSSVSWSISCSIW
jgi:hypothetical protein